VIGVLSEILEVQVLCSNTSEKYQSDHTHVGYGYSLDTSKFVPKRYQIFQFFSFVTFRMLSDSYPKNNQSFFIWF